MDIFDIINNKIKEICISEFGLSSDDISLNNIVCEPPKDETHGDVACNAAMVLAKKLGKNPREIATKITEKLKENNKIEKIEIAGAGFINVRLKANALYEILDYALKNSENFGKSNLGNGKKINVEYVSANPTGPMHIGHARNSVIGDALANLLKFLNYDVTKEYYINDAGTQVGVLAKSAFLRYKQALGEEIGEIPAGLYPGEYLADIAKNFAKIHGSKFQNNESPPEELKDFCISEIMKMIKLDLILLGVSHDVFSSEKSLHENKLIEKCLKFLEEKNLLYRGILEAPKGKQPDDWEPREQLLFKATEFGDDIDRPLQKSDGNYTYFTGDIAYHYDKYMRGFNEMVIVLGADHGGYVKRLKAVVKALSGGNGNIEVLISQLVKLVEDGVEVKMSKRSGKFITLKDVIDGVGKDVLRFIMLTKKADQPIDFDLKKVLESTKDNPVFYVQYASARVSSVLRQAAELGVRVDNDANYNLLAHKQELKLIKKIAEFPKMLLSAGRSFEPHKITFYLYDLASEFHYLWSLGREENIKFIDEGNSEITKARLALITAIKNTIKTGLNILGVEAIEKM